MATKLRLPPLPSVPDMLKLYRLRARKQLSQNFLFNERITNKLVNQLGKMKHCQVMEVGPGPGSITRSLMKKFPEKIIVVEKDKRFKSILQMLADSFSTVDGKMKIIFNDIRKVDMASIFDENYKEAWTQRCPRVYVIGNLPFSVSTRLIIEWLEDISKQSGLWKIGRVRMCLTFQQEVAERLIAQPCDKQRCRLSVMAQAWTNPVYCFPIKGSSFIPQPDVDVGVVKFEPLMSPRTSHDFEFFEKICRHVFAFRRKYSIHSIRTLFPPYHEEDLAALMLNIADLNPESRPVELSVEDIDRLCSAYKFILEKYPEVKEYNYRASRKILPQSQKAAVSISEFSDDYSDDLMDESESGLPNELENMAHLETQLEDQVNCELKGN